MFNIRLKNLLTLIIGTGLAQAVPILASPLLTRIYSPEQFGVYGIYVSSIVILALIICLRFDFLIITGESLTDSNNKLMLSIFTILASTTILFVILTITNFFLEVSYLYYFLILISAALLSLNSSMSYFLLKSGSFKKLSFNRFQISFFIVFFQILFGTIFSIKLGLIYGQALSLSILNITLLTYFYKNGFLINLSLKGFKKLFCMSKEYPVLVLPAHLMNAMALQLPVIFMGALFGVKLAGIYYLVNRVIMTPIAIFSKTLGDIFKKEASDISKKRNTLLRLYIKSVINLALLSIVPFILFYIYCDRFFILVFGLEWKDAGTVCKILLPMFFLKFTIVPVSTIFLIMGRSKLELVWQGLFLLFSALSIFIGFVKEDFYIMLVILSVSLSFLYVLIFLLGAFTIKGKNVNA